MDTDEAYAAVMAVLGSEESIRSLLHVSKAFRHYWDSVRQYEFLGPGIASFSDKDALVVVSGESFKPVLDYQAGDLKKPQLWQEYLSARPGITDTVYRLDEIISGFVNKV